MGFEPNLEQVSIKVQILGSIKNYFLLDALFNWNYYYLRSLMRYWVLKLLSLSIAFNTIIINQYPHN